MLTGRYRYRVENVFDEGHGFWFSRIKHAKQLVVLQLEVSETYDDAELDLGALPDIRTRTYWRDATPEDLMVDKSHEPRTASLNVDTHSGADGC